MYDLDFELKKFEIIDLVNEMAINYSDKVLYHRSIINYLKKNKINLLDKNIKNTPLYFFIIDCLQEKLINISQNIIINQKILILILKLNFKCFFIFV